MPFDKEKLEKYRQKLLLLRARLRDDANGLGRAALISSEEASGGDLSHIPTHMADQGTENFEQEFNLSLLQNEGAALDMVNSALERINRGEYGTCARCEKRIPQQRLDAIPYTAYCVHCAEIEQ